MTVENSTSIKNSFQIIVMDKKDINLPLKKSNTSLENLISNLAVSREGSGILKNSQGKDSKKVKINYLSRRTFSTQQLLNNLIIIAYNYSFFRQNSQFFAQTLLIYNS